MASLTCAIDKHYVVDKNIGMCTCTCSKTLHNITSNFQTSKTPLQEAIDNEHIEVTKLLMKAVTEVNKKVKLPLASLCPHNLVHGGVLCVEEAIRISREVGRKVQNEMITIITW